MPEPARFTAAEVYRLLNPRVRAGAHNRARSVQPPWVGVEDLQQLDWVICGQLAARYTPHAGVPPAHYFNTAFVWAVRNAIQHYSPRVQEFSNPHAQVCAARDQTADAPDYATSAACAELLRELPDQERLVLWLAAVEGLTLPQVARHLGIGRSTAYDTYARAIRYARAFWSDAA